MRKLGPSIRTFEHRRIKPEEKKADPFYLTPEYRAWREKVIGKAGRRCEAVDHGNRCRKSEFNRPPDRMFADHIKEVRDGGAKYDPVNGQCLCGRHHTLKTVDARAKRLAQ